MQEAGTSAVQPRVTLLIDIPIGAYLHYCVQLGNALAATGRCSVQVLALFEDRANPGVPEDERRMFGPGLGFEVLGPAGGSRLRRYWSFFVRFIRHLRELRRDRAGLVHVHTGTGWPLFDTGLLLVYRLLRIPVVRTIHELTTAERIGDPTAFERALGAFQVRLAHVAIAHDEAERDRLLVLLGDREVAVVPHGNYLCFRSGRRSREADAEESQGPMRLLFMGVKRHKGIEVFLEAMEHLLGLGAAVTATVIGRVNTGDEDLLERIRTLPNVRLEAGYVANSDMERQYRRHDLVALPYIRGTTSGAVHLAYAFDRPVIASDLPCFRELVIEGETGFVVRAGDAMALAEGIQRALDVRDSLPHMGAVGFLNVSRPRYAWDRIADRTLRIYHRAMAKNRGKAIPAAYAPVEGEDSSPRSSDLAASRTSLT